MHRCTTIRVHQQVHAMNEAPHNPLERPSVLDFDSVCLPEFSHPSYPSTLALELHRGRESDYGSVSGHLDTTQSTMSHDGASRVLEKTGVTTFDDDDDVDEAHFCDPVLGCDKQDQNMYDLHPRISPYEGLANIAPVIHFSGPPFGDGEVVDSPPGFTRVGTDRDQLSDKLEQRVGPARHYHQLGICKETLELVALQANGIRPNLGQVNALWRKPEESNSEVREAIKEVKRLDLLPDPTPSTHPQGSNTPPHDTEVASGLFSAAAQSSTTGGTPPPIEGDWKPSPLPSDSARKARMNETEGKILRMMPLNHEIHFDIDKESFWSAGFHRDTTDRIEYAARIVDREFRKNDLGIAFAYVPGPGPKAFSVRYDPSITGDTLALAFFPSDGREHWQVRISYKAAVSCAFGGRLEYMHNILAHEFMHILGFRHWNAGFDAGEMQVPSVHLPGTLDRDHKSVMFTSVHGRLWFNREDYRAIRRIYSAPSGDTVGGCLIVDVDPYA